MLGRWVAVIGVVFVLAACETADQETLETGAAQPAPDSFAPAAPPPGSQEELAQRIGDRVFFGFDRFDLTPEARATLDRQAEWMRRYPNITVTIEGHADERGTREYNIGLGHRRASAVRSYLIALGVPASRVDSTSYGKERPAVLGSTESAWAQNRRAVTVVN